MKESKLALGTVQFGLPYGINNKNGIPSESELKHIFKIAAQTGINVLDTASAYGNAEEKIGELASNNFQIISKFNKVSNKIEFENNLNNTLRKLRSTSVYGYLAHVAENLIDYPDSWKLLLESKEKGRIQKIGFSVYTTTELEKLLSLQMFPDIVQVPYSLLDRKFEKLFLTLKKNKCEIHVRSIFLQGLYFLNPDKLPPKLYGFKKALLEIKSICNDNRVSISKLALNFANSNPNIDKIVIGIDNVIQLVNNIESIETWENNPEIIEKVNLIDIYNQELLNPSNW